jgi:hypothetical protein
LRAELLKHDLAREENGKLRWDVDPAFLMWVEAQQPPRMGEAASGDDAASRVLIAYHHGDEEPVQLLLEHLTALSVRGVERFDDARLEKSGDFRADVARVLQKAFVVVVFFCPEFLGCQALQDTLRAIMEAKFGGRVELYTVITHACDLTTSGLASYRPVSEEPLCDGMRFGKRNRILLETAQLVLRKLRAGR